MKNNLKFIFRTPVRTILFCIIFICSSALFSAGIHLWLQITHNIKQAEEAFSTVGKVRQISDGTYLESRWDAGLDTYVYSEKESYSRILDEDILKGLDAEYVSSWQKRPYFGAYSDDLLTGGEETAGTDEMMLINAVVEFTPLEDCVPDSPVKVELTRILWGNEAFAGSEIDFCDHGTEDPAPLKAGKTYIAYIGVDPVSVKTHEGFTGLSEYKPLRLFENQTKLWEEVTEDFYETESGRRWETIVGAIQKRYKMLPVTPVTDLELIDAFRLGDAVLAEGEAIGQEEYEDFPYVCMVPQSLAARNDLEIGDTIDLRYLFADYEQPLCEAAYTTGGLQILPLDRDGNEFPVFQESEYRIIGIYSYPAALTSDPYALEENQIFVPAQSITETFEDNIAGDGPMQLYNTAFRIQNGTIEEFMEQFVKLEEYPLLEIQFDDGGYENFASKMEQIQTIAFVLWTAGLLLLLAVIAFLLFYQVILQRRRTAVERALGRTKKQCVMSLLSGVMLLTVLCVTVGTAAGSKAEQYVNLMADDQNEYFDSAFSKGAAAKETDAEELPQAEEKDGAVTVILIVSETAAVLLLALIFIHLNLRIPPIQILSFKEIE